jgi:hypothetical protein
LKVSSSEKTDVGVGRWFKWASRQQRYVRLGGYTVTPRSLGRVQPHIALAW